MSLIGKPGTKLIFTENSFVIDFEPEHEGEKFEISEVNLEMDFTKKMNPPIVKEKNSEERKSWPEKLEFYNSLSEMSQKFHSLSFKSQNTTPSIMKDFLLPFFIIRGNSIVELRDCLINLNSKPKLQKHKSSRNSDLRTNGGESTKKEFRRISTGNSELIQIGFLLERMKNKFPKLALLSCNVSGFSQIVECERNSSLYMERSRFLEIKFHAINMSNPFELRVRGCSFNKIGLSCLNIRISKVIEEVRKILVEDNEFYEANYGVSFYSETKEFTSYFAEFIDNKFSYCQKDAIRLKNLNLIGLEIYSNEVKCSKRQGIYMQSVFNQESDIPVVVKKNRLTHCEGSGLYIQDSMVTVEENVILANNNGGILVEGVFGLPKIRCIIANSNINQNQNFGLLVKGLFNSNLRVSNCILMENKNGIVFETIGKLSQHFISNNKIVNNFETGILFHHLNGKAWLVDNYFEGNVVCEIISQLQSHSNINFTHQKIRKLLTPNLKKQGCHVF